MKKLEVIYCCQKCGTVQVLLEKIYNQKKYRYDKNYDQKKHCPFCDSIMIKTSGSISSYELGIDKKYKTWQDVVRKQYAKPKHRDDELFAKREIEDLNKETSERRSNIEQKKQQDELRKLKGNSSKIEEKNFIPKCPTCGSADVKPIGSGERTLSVITFGLLSNKINKSYKCLNCKYTW